MHEHSPEPRDLGVNSSSAVEETPGCSLKVLSIDSYTRFVFLGQSPVDQLYPVGMRRHSVEMKKRTLF